jgi:hypothetical protein
MTKKTRLSTILIWAAAWPLVGGLLPRARATVVADYYKCSNREGGEWNYGRAPNVCTANAFGDDKVILGDYPDLIFNDKATRTSERARFTQQTYAAIRDAAQYYIRQRKPNVSAQELSEWTLAIELVAAHESRMSHYRKTADARLKLMRGDVGHGHGLMQIDDRAHFDAVNKGLAWNFITNLTYAMDIFYQQWERAPSQSCVGSSTNWSARIRAAWAAYNGGAGSICRWTNPKSKWAQNDANFLAIYNSRSWKSYVADESAPASIDAACLIENRENCPAPGDEPQTPVVGAGKLYRLPDQSACALFGGSLHCVEETRDAICLNALGEVDTGKVYPLDANTAATYPLAKEDRHALCAKYDPTLIGVGAYLQIQTPINVRATPGGNIIAVTHEREVYEVLDFEIRNRPTNDRYYQILIGGRRGYIYAGDAVDHNGWAVPAANPSPWPSTVARVGQKIRIVTRSGINMRQAPGGKLILAIAKGSVLTVQGVKMQGDANEVYYQVSYGGHTGYIYSGVLLPKSTVPLWTEIVE